MSSSNVSIKFNDYIVNEFSYSINQGFKNKDDDQKLSMPFSLSAVVNFHDESSNVTLIADIGDVDDEDCPFLIKAQITGIFELNITDDEDYQKFAPNLIAICFPYLRSLVSSISEKNNVFPFFTLPVMNIYEMMKEEGAIEIIDSRTK